MSVAIMVKVYDGIILAADSAVSLSDSSTRQVITGYQGGSKVFNLHRDLPLGAMTWGQANIGPASLAALMKDLRSMLSHGEGQLAPDRYTVQEVTETARTFLLAHHKVAYSGGGASSAVALAVVGYSANVSQPEIWEFEISEAGEAGPVQCARAIDQVGLSWRAAAMPIFRLVFGYDPRLRELLANRLEPAEAADQIIAEARQQFEVGLVQPPMPIIDAIELADFLVRLASFWERFTPGYPVVGGEVEIAAITKHEAFKWVRRKHYYSREYNPYWAGDQHDNQGETAPGSDNPVG